MVLVGLKSVVWWVFYTLSGAALLIMGCQIFLKT